MATKPPHQMVSGLGTAAVVDTGTDADDVPLNSSVAPVGEIKMFGGAAAPTGYLLCDGSAVSRETYAALFAVIADTYGAGDGSTTFSVPNFKGRSPVGVGQGDTAEGGVTGTDRALGDTGGAETHTLIEAEMPAHTHSLPNVNTALAHNAGANSVHVNGSGTSGSAGSDDPHNNMHPFLAVNFIIKT